MEAIFSRNVSSAKEYALRHNIRFSGSYDQIKDFLGCFNTAYISTPNSLHFDFSSKLLEMGKNVICEKPLCFSPHEAKKLNDLSNKRQVGIMDAYHYKYHPHTRKQIDDIQKIIPLMPDTSMDVFIGIPMPLDDDIRLNKSMGGGAFAHLGCYMTDLLTSLNIPLSNKEIQINKLKRYRGVDTYVEGCLNVSKVLEVNFVFTLEHCQLESYATLKNSYGERTFHSIFTPKSFSSSSMPDSLSSYYFQLDFAKKNLLKNTPPQNINLEGVQLFSDILRQIHCKP